MSATFAAALWAKAPGITRRLLSEQGWGYGFRDSLDHDAAFAADMAQHVEFLLAALEFHRPALFVEYTDWARTVVSSSGVSLAYLVESYRAVRDLVCGLSEMGEAERACALLDEGITCILSAASPPPPAVGNVENEETAKLALCYLEQLIAGRRTEATALVLSAMDDGLSVDELYLEVLQPALRETGRLWQVGEISVAQEHYISAVTQILIARIYPRLDPSPPNGKVLLAACVSLNLHDIGLRFLCDLFELRGWDTHFLGANTPVESLHRLVLQRKPDIVAISASLATHLHPAAEFIRHMRSAPDSRSIPVIAGGVVFLSHVDLWKQIGADGFAPDAVSAIELAQTLV